MPPAHPRWDISKELKFLASCQQALEVPKGLVQLFVVDAKGSLPDVVRMLQPWAQEASAYAYCKELLHVVRLSAETPQVVPAANDAATIAPLLRLGSERATNANATCGILL